LKQHTKPCKECPFRRKSLPGYLGGNGKQEFAVIAQNEGALPCHLVMTRPNPAHCVGRATMWANQCKRSRDGSVPKMEQDRDNVFSHIGEFTEHHGIKITPLQLMGAEPLGGDDEI